MKQYTIEYLLNEFREHSKEYEKQKEEYLKSEGEGPPYSEFNLPEAFILILKEIQALKNAAIQP